MTQHSYPTHYRQQGVSMVELMIAMLLGLFLMAGVLTLFTSNKSTFLNMEGISQIQESGRTGLERLKSRVRMMGYMGCSNVGVQPPNNKTFDGTLGTPNPAVPFDASVLVFGTDNATNITVAGTVNSTDTLTVISTSAADTAMSVDMTATNSNLTILTNPNNFQIGDTILITDCENADIFTISDLTGTGPFTLRHTQNDIATGTQVNVNSTLSKPYLQVNSLVMSMQNLSYNIQNTGRTDESGNPIFSLFETPAGGASVEIITGVEDMQVLYGVDTGGPPGIAVNYVVAGAVTNWASVASIRLSLLISTARDIGPNPRPYTNLIPAVVAAPGDNRMRRTFTTTIALRSRNP